MPVQAAEALLVILRWVHGMSAVAFLGYLLVYAFDAVPEGTAARFRDVMEITLITFAASGIVLALDRLSQGAGSAYAAVLVAKVVISLAAYQVAFRWWRAGLPPKDARVLIALACGTGAMLLAAVLKGIADNGLRGS